MNTQSKCFAIVICWLLCTPALSNLQTIENRKCEITNVIWTKGMDVVIERMPNGRQKKTTYYVGNGCFPTFILSNIFIGKYWKESCQDEEPIFFKWHHIPPDSLYIDGKGDASFPKGKYKYKLVPKNKKQHYTYLYLYSNPFNYTIYITNDSIFNQTPIFSLQSGSRVYDNGVLSRLLFDGGYVSFRDSVPTYHYYIRDYLGNNRVVADAHGNVEDVNHYYPYGALMGDSRNTGLQPYKYIGKELDRTHGLDWYAHGARHYAPCPPIPLLNFRLARLRHRCTHADQK